MPWKDTSVVEERMKFVVSARNDATSMAALCREHGISRTTGYKWLQRFEAGGPGALEDRPSVAQANANAVGSEEVKLVVDLRREHPTWGPKKLRARLLNLDKTDVPSASAIGDILKRNGLIRPRRRRPYAPREFTGLTIGEQPNDVWCVDFKGDFLLGDKTRCWPLTVTDFWSRYLIACVALLGTKEAPARVVFEQLFGEFGLPQVIRSDGGVPFSSTGIGGLNPMVIWWIKLGITPEVIEPGHPEQNGRHERMHRTLKAEATRPPAKDREGQQAAFDRFRYVFNDIRPHEALGQKPPTSLYSVSKRSLPASLEPLVYEESLLTKRLDKQGRLGLFGGKVAVTRMLANENVGLEEAGDGVMSIYFGPLRLGEVRRKGKDVVLERGPRRVRAAIRL